jgi:DNA-binding transcriptional LysR family regulator
MRHAGIIAQDAPVLVSVPALCCSSGMQSRFRNWADVRAFLAVMREGSTLAASRRLDMAQPTVARRIEALEHETGLVLFDRDSRGFHPTDAARALLADAEALEAAALRFEGTARDLSRPRPIRVTAVSASLVPSAAQIIGAFSALHPGIGFEFLPGARPLDLAAGEADVALRFVTAAPDPDLIRRHIATVRFTLYGAPSYAAAHGLPDRPEAMQAHRLVAFHHAHAPFPFRDWLLQYVTPDRIVMSFSEMELVDAVMRTGQALGIRGLWRVAQDEAGGALLRCFEPPAAWSSEHLLLVSPDAWRRPEVKAFVTYFAPRYAATFR